MSTATSGSLLTEVIDEDSPTLSSHEDCAGGGEAELHNTSSSSSDSGDDDHGAGGAVVHSNLSHSPVHYKNQHKFPYMCSELLCGEVGNVVEVLVGDERLLLMLFSLLQRPPPLDPSSVSYFRKVLQVLIQRKYGELVSFCAHYSILDGLLRHLGLYSIMELLIMLGWDSGLMEASIDQSWMLSQRLIPKLVRRLSPAFYSSPDVHAHAGRLLVDVVVKVQLPPAPRPPARSPYACASTLARRPRVVYSSNVLLSLFVCLHCLSSSSVLCKSPVRWWSI